MKFRLIVLMTLMACGCSAENAQRLPTAPSSPSTTTAPNPTPAPNSTAVYGFVLKSSGLCIEGATVQIVRGQASSQSITQITPCDAWSYGNGFTFENLTAGVEVTIRASATGYVTKEVTVFPSAAFIPIVLARVLQ